MSRNESEDIERLHVMLFTSDIDWLRSRFARDSIGMSKAIRIMIRSGIKNIQEREAKELTKPRIELTEEDLEEERP